MSSMSRVWPCGLRAGRKGSPKRIREARDPGDFPGEIAKPSIPSVFVSRRPTEPVVTLKFEETDFEFIADAGAANS